VQFHVFQATICALLWQKSTRPLDFLIIKMSNASPILNGENTGGVADFSTDASVNMVAAIHDHISCAKPVQVEPFNTQDSKTGILAYSCEFDHMYASLTEGATVQKDGAEVKHLKELLLLHLDLIQQQSEQLVTKDKQLSALRQENETVSNVFKIVYMLILNSSHL